MISDGAACCFASKPNRQLPWTYVQDSTHQFSKQIFGFPRPDGLSNFVMYRYIKPCEQNDMKFNVSKALNCVVSCHVLLVSLAAATGFFCEQNPLVSYSYMTICLWSYFLLHSAIDHLRQQSSFFGILDFELITAKRLINDASVLWRRIQFMDFRSSATHCIIRIRETWILICTSSAYIGDNEHAFYGSIENSSLPPFSNSRAPIAQEIQRVEQGNNRDKKD